MESHIDLGAAIDGIETVLCNCKNCGNTETMLNLVAHCGVKFLRPIASDPNRRDANPGRRIEESGSIIVPLTITHKLLGRDAKLLSLGWETPLADLGYIAECRSIAIDQTNSPGAETLEEMVRGQVALAGELTPELGVTYGWVDVGNEQTLPRRVARFTEVTNWFYCNVFGPELVNDAPLGFFRNLPVHENRILADGSVVIRSTASYAEWVKSEHEVLVNYLSQRMPQAALFRCW